MSSRSGLAVGVACLVVMAGCGAFVGGSSQPETETVTPAPVPTNETGVGSGGARASGPGTGASSDGVEDGTDAPPVPPGVSPDGSVNVTALASAHETYLAPRSYDWTFEYRVTRDDTTLLTRTHQVRAGTDALLVSETTTGVGTNDSVYVADGVGYVRTNHVSRTSVHQMSHPRDRETYTAIAGGMVRRFVADVSFTVTVVDRDGQTYYRLHAVDVYPPDSLRLADRGQVWDYTATVYVTPEGFVRTIVAEYHHLPFGGDRPEDRVNVSFRYDYAGVGSSTVVRTTWDPEVTPTPTGTLATASSTATSTAPPTATSPTTTSPAPLTVTSPTPTSPAANSSTVTSSTPAPPSTDS